MQRSCLGRSVFASSSQAFLAGQPVAPTLFRYQDRHPVVDRLHDRVRVGRDDAHGSENRSIRCGLPLIQDKALRKKSSVKLFCITSML